MNTGFGGSQNAPIGVSNLQYMAGLPVEDCEGEEVFFDEHKVIVRDALHSGNEERFILLGKTKKGRLLFVVFTKRAEKIRIISVGGVNKKEAHLYEKAISTSAI